MKYFLDCGSNLGQGFEHFRKIYGEDFQYKLFEPLTTCYDFLVEKYSDLENVEIFNQAVYIENCIKSFGCSISDSLHVGGSLIENHNSSIQNNTKQYYQVSCVDFIEFIDNIYNIGDEIIMKLDIESGEYDVLEKMIATGTIFKIKKIYCEFHSCYMSENDKTIFISRESNIINFMKTNHINFIQWDETV